MATLTTDALATLTTDDFLQLEDYSLFGEILLANGVDRLLLADGTSRALLSGGPETGDKLLLVDGVSSLLLVNGVDNLLLIGSGAVGATVAYAAFSLPQHRQVITKMIGY